MDKKLNGSVATILDNGLSVVINRGLTSGVREGMRYLIYNLGDEIRDPETNEPLGTLEIVCGIGVVRHVQEKLSTIVSCKKDTSVTKIIKPKCLMRGFERLMPETEERTEQAIPFNGVQVGSLAKCLG